MTIEALAELRRYGPGPADDVRAIRVVVRRRQVELELGFRLDGNVSSIRLTPSSGPQNPTELWRHTCFETFVAIDGQAAYHEFNFAPSGEWRVYAFRAYRAAAPLMNALHVLSVTTRVTGQRVELDTRIVLSGLSAVHLHSPLRLGLSAVIESQEGSLSYWALRHPTDKPDFHDAAAFSFRLEPPTSE
jgi:hypothetical protein